MKKNYYGNFIDYDVDLDGTTNDYDWKIFYYDKNKKNLYIIAEDYVPMANSLMPTITERTKNSDNPYSLYWPYNSGNIQNGKDGSADIFGDATHNVATKTLNIANKFLADWKPKVTGTNSASENSNAKMVATLMDTSLWANFATRTKINGLTNKADELSAIGGPTLEMWVKSWNAKHGTESDDTNKLQLYYASNATGYFVGTLENPDTNANISTGEGYYAFQTGTTGYTDTLYYPHPLDSNGNLDTFTTTNNCYGYWLASPSADNSSSVVDVGHDGGVGSSGFDGAGDGVRPVVCLPSDITATWNETDGVWNIIKRT